MTQTWGSRSSGSTSPKTVTNEKRHREYMNDKEKCRRDESYGRKDYFDVKTPNQTREVYATMIPWAGNFGHDR